MEFAVNISAPILRDNKQFLKSAAIL